jgi:hypothetical protein
MASQKVVGNRGSLERSFRLHEVRDLLGNDSRDYQIHSASAFVSLMNIRLPAIVGCAHVALSAMV